jgi:hypothetical protein
VLSSLALRSSSLKLLLLKPSDSLSSWCCCGKLFSL